MREEDEDVLRRAEEIAALLMLFIADYRTRAQSRHNNSGKLVLISDYREEETHVEV